MIESAELLRLGAAGVLSLIGLYGLTQIVALTATRSSRRAEIRLPDHATPVFLFDRDTLIDASPSAAALIAETAMDMSDQAALIQVLSHQFPNLRANFKGLEPGAQVVVPGSPDCGLTLTLTEERGLLRVSLDACDIATGSHAYEELEGATLMEELNLLRLIARDTPQLICREDAQGELIWANAAYLSYADRLMPHGDRSKQIWPGERLFTDIQPPLPTDPRTFEGRHALQSPGEKAEHWFEITAVPKDGSVLYFAIDANATVRAERAQRDFQQTLGKTFAHLSTGLAIFNKKRQLAIFNPALLDMTGLPFAFLSARPNIDRVLDRLRETRKLPEPKNYNSWREQFSALEAAAMNGTYTEWWDMPDGQTFRVTGRPHPDGALAFLFEDISAEVSLTRRFRSEIETSQAVLNAVPDAIAVFSSGNTLIMTNAAYEKVWRPDEDGQMTVHDLRGALRIWKANAAPHCLVG